MKTEIHAKDLIDCQKCGTASNISLIIVHFTNTDSLGIHQLLINCHSHYRYYILCN